jgi:hypothetical protein
VGDRITTLNITTITRIVAYSSIAPSAITTKALVIFIIRRLRRKSLQLRFILRS